MKTLKTITKFSIFLCISFLLFFLVYRGQDIEKLKLILKTEVNYWWVVFSLFLGLLSHICRTVRWIILIETTDGKVRFKNAFLAVMIGYFANLALPRMGEFTRCGIISKYEGKSFPKVLGTVVLERAIDMLMFLILLVIVVVTQFHVVVELLNRNPEIKEAIYSFLSAWYTLAIVVFIVSMLYIFRTKIKQLGFYKKISHILKDISDGFKSLKRLDNKLPFVFHTLAIWVLYYLMLYVVFFAFDFTSHLSPLVGLAVFALSTIGMVLPIQGGIGAWHFVVISSLMIYLPNVENISTLSRAFAFLAHSSMNLMIVFVGVLAMIALPLLNRKK